MSYEAMDQIISYAKTRWPNTHIKYSTVTEYLKAVQDDNKDWPENTKDNLVPHLFDSMSYWSGYYTTDPSFKKRTNDFTQITRSISTLGAL